MVGFVQLFSVVLDRCVQLRGKIPGFFYRFTAANRHVEAYVTGFLCEVINRMNERMNECSIAESAEIEGI